jgi:hypothetical protein
MQRPTHLTRTIFLVVLIFASLACSLAGVTQSPAPASGIDETKIALSVQGTVMANQLTAQAAQLQNAQQQPTAQPQIQPTSAPPPTNAPPPPPPTVQATPTEDMAARIKDAKILVYEDAASAGLGEWVKSTLNLMGLNYTHDADALGNFMSHLNSSTPWDLIIVAGESRSGVQGEFWDIIAPKVTRDKTALIVEMWYLENTANGRIQALTSECGIEYQSTKKFVESIYTLDTSNPIFSTPNGGFALTNYVGYWTDKGGDYVRLTGGGDATLLAGGLPNEKSRYGLLTSCIGGRVIFQTFSTHDYHREDMQMLWENYIVNTLTNHFNALP